MADGKILSVNDWVEHPVPRLAIVRTLYGVKFAVRADVSKDLLAELQQLIRREAYSLEPELQHQSRYLDLLDVTAMSQVVSGPAYYFENSPKPQKPVRLLATDERALIQSGLTDWLDDVAHQQPFAVALESGQAIAICSSTRIGQYLHEPGVECLPQYRRQGYAAAVVSAWAQAVKAKGAQALYSTTESNRASQMLAQSLGLKHYAQDFCIY